MVRKLDKHWCVYKHKNKSNGKCYIGITCQKTYGTVAKRGWLFWQHFFLSCNKKYTWDGFVHEILTDNLSKRDAEDIEKALIRESNSNNPAFGYNITSGGDGSVGLKHSDATRKKIAESRISRFCGAARETGADASSIRRCCLGEYQHSHGLEWAFFENKTMTKEVAAYG